MDITVCGHRNVSPGGFAGGGSVAGNSGGGPGGSTAPDGAPPGSNCTAGDPDSCTVVVTATLVPIINIQFNLSSLTRHLHLSDKFTLGCVASALWQNKGVLALDALSIGASFVPGGKGLFSAGAAVIGSYTGAAALGIGIADKNLTGATFGSVGHYASNAAGLMEGAKGLASNLPVFGQAVAIGGGLYDAAIAIKDGGCLGGEE